MATPERVTTRQVVLAVDDVIANLIAVSNILQNAFTVSIATSGREALEILDNGLVDAAVLDIEMPEMSGFELFAEMQKDPATRTIPVVFATSDKSAGSVREALKLGAAGYITRPYDNRALLARVLQAITSSPVDQAVVYLRRTLSRLRDACLRPGSDHNRLLMRFFEIPHTLFVPRIRLQLNRLETLLNNNDLGRAARVIDSILADLPAPPAPPAPPPPPAA